MPERPEVVYFKIYVDSTSLHQNIKEVEILNDTILANISDGDLHEGLKGKQFLSSSTHGKYFFFTPTMILRL